MVAHPPLATNVPCCHVLTFFSSTRFVAASACWRNLSTQIGVSAATTARSARCFACASAVAPVTQPPHENPTIASATAPPTAPQHAGFSSEGTCMAIQPFDFLGKRIFSQGRILAQRGPSRRFICRPAVVRRCNVIQPALFVSAAMTRIDEFHDYADQCLEVARSCRDPERRSLWIDMAERLTRLAEFREAAERQSHTTAEPRRSKLTRFQ